MSLAGWIVPLRGVHLAAVLSVTGAMVFRAAMVARGTSSRLVIGSFGVATMAGVAWLVVQSATMAGVGIWESAGAVGVVSRATVFGHAWLLRMGLLGLAALAWRRRRVAAGLAMLAAAAEPGLGHAIAAQGWGLAVANALHVTAAGVWLGGLIPLLLVVRAGPGAAAAAARRFAPVGVACVVVIAATAVVQGMALAGGWVGLTGTDYGAVVWVKIGLFGVLVALAALNHWRFAPRVAARPGGLVWSVGVEAVVGVCVVFVAAWLSQMDPGGGF